VTAVENVGVLIWEKGGLEKYTFSRLTQAIFQAKHFPEINSPTFSTPVTLHTYPPMNMEQMFRNVGI
jgi:hypothetical protein